MTKSTAKKTRLTIKEYEEIRALEAAGKATPQQLADAQRALGFFTARYQSGSLGERTAARLGLTAGDYLHRKALRG